jgi:CubicO group peptidase (beta-lactamase class C family)
VDRLGGLGRRANRQPDPAPVPAGGETLSEKRSFSLRVRFETLRIVCCISALLAIAQSADGAPNEARLAAKVEAYLAPLVAARDFGGVILIARGGKPIVQKALGLADLELNVPMATRSRFRIASITKTFTGAAVVMISERGKLSYDDPLSKYIPDFPNGDRIKIRHLLLHASGVDNPDSLPCSEATLDDLVAELARKPLNFEPGTKSRYSNGGYALLARVIERASGKSWQDFLRDEIFSPLSLTETAADRPGAIIPRRVPGYVPGPGETRLRNASCQGAWAAIGSGALISSTTDLHRWARAVRDQTLFKRGVLEHPYGWGVRKYFDRSAIEQSGILDGAMSYLAAYLDEDLYVVVLSNVQSGNLENIGKGLAALALGAEPPKLTLPPAAMTSTPEQRRRWLGRFANSNIGTFEIREKEADIYLRWTGAKDDRYLAMTGGSTLYDRQDGGALELTPDAAKILIRWGDSPPQEFVRAP